MRSRIFFAAIIVFWVVMNYLLWRSQSAAHSGIGSAVPPEVVWQKILTAPDNSSLEIYDHDKKMGFCHWNASEGSATQAFNQTLSEDYVPDGLIPQPTGYELSLEGNSTIFATNHVRFEMQLRLSTNQAWQDFHFAARVRPVAWDLHAIAAAQKIAVKMNDDGSVWQKTFKFSDFQHPETLLADFGGSDALGPAGSAFLPLLKGPGLSAALLPQWSAHEDWMQFGHSRVQVYRLETQILGQRLIILTSRVGEILWVDAPNKLTLRNEAFSHF